MLEALAAAHEPLRRAYRGVVEAHLAYQEAIAAAHARRVELERARAAFDTAVRATAAAVDLAWAGANGAA
jgi:hypothetical protein